MWGNSGKFEVNNFLVKLNKLRFFINTQGNFSDNLKVLSTLSWRKLQKNAQKRAQHSGISLNPTAGDFFLRNVDFLMIQLIG